MPVTIPFIRGEVEQRIDIALGGEPYHFRARWNERDAAWYLDVYESDRKTPIALSVRVVLGALLAPTSTHPLFRSSALVPISDDSMEEAGLQDLGVRVNLVYFDPFERLIGETLP